MGSHPVNLVIRFLLEIAVLISTGMWGWNQDDRWFRLVFAIGIPLILATIWGTFAVPGDPSRSGSAPVPIPGIIRLILELGFFTFAVWSLHQIGYIRPGFVFGIIVVLHYVVSYDRIIWLVRN